MPICIGASAQPALHRCAGAYEPKYIGGLHLNEKSAQSDGLGGEIQLTDAIQKLNEIQRVFAYEFEGKRYDVGEKLGFIKTTIEFAVQNEELRDDLLELMENIVEKTKQHMNVQRAVIHKARF